MWIFVHAVLSSLMRQRGDERRSRRSWRMPDASKAARAAAKNQAMRLKVRRLGRYAYVTLRREDEPHVHWVIRPIRGCAFSPGVETEDSMVTSLREEYAQAREQYLTQICAALALYRDAGHPLLIESEEIEGQLKLTLTLNRELYNTSFAELAR
jgi:hypothetical protein